MLSIQARYGGSIITTSAIKKELLIKKTQKAYHIFGHQTNFKKIRPLPFFIFLFFSKLYHARYCTIS